MKNIKDFYNHLSDREKELICKTLLTNQRASKSKLLLNRINNYEEFAETLIAKDLYNNEPNSSYSHLKRRLKESIIEIVYKHEISDQSDNSLLSDKAKCQKYLMLASLLIERGMKDEAKAYLKQAEKVIKDRQLSIEKFMLHMLLLEVHDFPDENVNISKEISKDLRDLSYLGLSKTKFHKIRIQGYTAAGIPNDSDDSLSDNNALSLYYKLSTEISKYIELFQYANASDYSSKLMLLVQKSANSFSRPEIINARLMHLRVIIYTMDLKSATTLCSQIEKSDPLRFDMETELKILKWTISFLMKDYQKARKTLESLSSLNHAGEAEKSLISYFNLCLLFQERAFEKIISLLLQNNALHGTGSPVPHAIKVLEIYCYLELKKADTAMSKLLAFKQYLKRNHTLNRDRYQFIVKILIKLIKNNFQFGLTLDYCLRKSGESFKNDIQFTPDLHHYELIHVQEWLKQKSIEIGDIHCETVII